MDKINELSSKLSGVVEMSYIPVPVHKDSLVPAEWAV